MWTPKITQKKFHNSFLSHIWHLSPFCYCVIFVSHLLCISSHLVFAWTQKVFAEILNYFILFMCEWTLTDLLMIVCNKHFMLSSYEKSKFQNKIIIVFLREAEKKPAKLRRCDNKGKIWRKILLGQKSFQWAKKSMKWSFSSLFSHSLFMCGQWAFVALQCNAMRCFPFVLWHFSFKIHTLGLLSLSLFRTLIQSNLNYYLLSSKQILGKGQQNIFVH